MNLRFSNLKLVEPSRSKRFLNRNGPAAKSVFSCALLLEDTLCNK